jgi:hypothetical protein
MQSKRISGYAALLALVATLAACGGGGGTQDNAATQAQAPAAVAQTTTDDTRETAEGYALNRFIWPQLNIPVCWINPTLFNGAQRAWSQQAVARTWERYSQVRLTGWGQCPTVNQKNAIRIKIIDENPASWYGTDTKQKDVGMYLNFSFVTTPGFDSCRASGPAMRHCIETIAIHEFGHALGFAHEQDRPDTPQACKDQLSSDQIVPQTGATPIGGWDADSVMNYCSPRYVNNGRLTGTDIAMVQKYYKAPIEPDLTFDAAFYLATQADIRARYGNDQAAAEYHWIHYGRAEGRRGSRAFDAKYYLSKYPDLKAQFGSNYNAARFYWLNIGLDQGQRGSYEVDPAYLRTTQYRGYTSREAVQAWNRDNKSSRYLMAGSADFVPANYLTRYADVRQIVAYTSQSTTGAIDFAYDGYLTLLDWVNIGRPQGRNGK